MQTVAHMCALSARMGTNEHAWTATLIIDLTLIHCQICAFYVGELSANNECIKIVKSCLTNVGLSCPSIFC